MNYDVVILENFLQQLKKLARKYPSITKDAIKLTKSLAKNPTHGGDSLGNSLYKVRMAIKSKGHGKSFGARVIICIKVVDGIVYVPYIYDKSEKESLTKDEVNFILALIP